jgi:pteridine reductase
VSGDVRDSKAVRRIVDETQSRFGRIDALVNCAAIWNRKRLEEVTADDVREHLEVNTLGTFLCCQQVGLTMTAQPGGGAIVNIADWAVVRPYVDFAAYFPSKGAIPTLTRTFAVELARRNPRVRVNAILPGPVLLPPDLPAKEREEAINATLLKREGHPRHVAQAVLFLIQNDFVTGVCLPVDGGRSIYNGSFDRDG